jgi:hypothetical protein
MPRITSKPIQPPERPIEYFSLDLVEKSILGPRSNLYYFMEDLLGSEKAVQIQSQYLFGTSRHWPGATVFWQFDCFGRCRYGKVMAYDRITGKRRRESGRSYIVGVHSLIGHSDMNFRQCFFGEHLLAEDSGAKVGIVESEKSALIASAFLPGYTWLATGGKTGVKLSDLKVTAPLKGRSIILFPDLDGYPKWEAMAKEWRAGHGLNVQVSQFLKELASSKSLDPGADIADILIENALKSKGCNPPYSQSISSQFNTVAGFAG